MTGWLQNFEDLKAFIGKNPGIELSPSTICIPSDVRAEFYRLFDNVRLSIVRDMFPGLLEKGQVISREWNLTAREAIGSLKIKAIEMDSGTNWFLQDPADGLTRLLFDPLFEVIRGKKDFAMFEQSIPKYLGDGVAKFLHEGYHAWTTLSLLASLGVDYAYTVKPSELDKDPALHVEMAVPGLQEDIPEVETASVLSFKPSLKISFLIPNVIAHSPSLNSFISFVPDFAFSEAKWLGRNLDPQRKWLELRDIFEKFGQSDIWPDVAVYTGDHWKKLAVAADTATVAQPEVIIELRAEKGWYEREGLDSIRRHYDVLQPKWGSFVICLDDVPEAAIQELAAKPETMPAGGEIPGEPAPALNVDNNLPPADPANLPASPARNIRLLGVGFDVAKLEPIVAALSRQFKAGE